MVIRMVNIMDCRSWLFMALLAVFLVLASSADPKVLTKNSGNNACGTQDKPTVLMPNQGSIESSFTTDCYWVFNFDPPPKPGQPLAFEIRSLVLLPNDTLQVNTSKSNVYGLQKVQHGMMLLPVLSDDLNKATIHLHVDNSSTQPRLINIYYSYVTPLTLSGIPSPQYQFHIESSQTSTKLPHKYVINFNTPLPPTFKLVANVEYISLSGTTSATINDAVLKDAKVDSFIETNTFQVVFDNINYDSASDITLNFDKVDANCSSHYVNVENNQELTTISTEQAYFQGSYRCLWILESKGGVNNFYLNELKVNSAFALDSLELRDGGTRTSPLLFSASPPSSVNVDKYRALISDLVTSGNRLYILYSSPSLLLNPGTKYTPNNLNIKVSNQLKRLNGSNAQEVSILPVASELNGILYEAAPTDRAVFRMKNATPLSLVNTTLKVYDNFNLNSNPIAVFESGSVIPNELWSNTNQLLVLIQAAGEKPNQLNAIVLGVASSCSLTVNGPSVFHLVDQTSVIGKACRYFFSDLSSKTQKQYDFSLKITRLQLPTEKDCLVLQPVSSKGENAFSFCGPQSVDSPFDIIPNILLNSSMAYTLIYNRATANATNITLLQATFEFAPASLLTNRQLAFNTSDNFTLPNYPNSYPLMYDTTINHLITSENLMYLSFNDLDLATGDTLSLLQNNSTGFLANYSGKTLPTQDLIVSQRLLVMMKPVDIKQRFKNREWFASGYSINVESLECGGTLKENVLQTPNYPTELSNLKTGCAWILDLSEQNKADWLQFTVEWGQNGTQGDLKVYDNSNRRRQLFANMTGSGPYNVSVSTVVVEYTFTGKIPAKGFKLDFHKHECNATCDNGQRCVTEWNLCDGVAQCLDFKDEIHCNSSFPVPETKYVKVGLSGWIIVLLIIPISMAIGAVSALFGPRYVGQLRSGQYQGFANFEDA